MKNLFSTVAILGMIAVPSVVLADGAPVEVPSLPVSVFIEPNTYYAVDSETMNSEIKTGISVFGVYTEVVPTFSVNDLKFSSATAEVGYNLDIGVITVTPYVKASFDSDFAREETYIGLKTRIDF